MAVNLAKICADLSHPDPQIKTFALMSITRLSRQIVDAPSEIRDIARQLKPLSTSENPDVVFLARKAFNHIDSHFKECLSGDATEEVGTQAPPVQVEVPTEVEPLAPGVPAIKEVPLVPASPAPIEPVEPAPAVEPVPQVDAASPPSPEPPSPQPPMRKDPAQLGREEILQLLTDDLEPTYLASLLIQMSTKGTRDDLAAIESALTHADDRVRANAIEVFEQLGDASHSAKLVPLLQDTNNRARGNAILALDRMGYRELEPAVTTMLTHPTMSMRETAVYVLSRLDRPYTEALLTRALQDPYEGVRLRATRALAKFPTRDSVTALKRMLNDLDINICEAASESLRSIKGLLQSQRAAMTGSTAQAAADTQASLKAKPRQETRPSQPAAPPGIEDLYRSLGTEIYQLCRLNAITHENLDSIFYEVLRYQDFLRNYMVKRGDPEDETRKSAIEHLQQKIKASFALLGKQAAELLAKGQLTLPDKDGEPIRKILGEIGSLSAAPSRA